MRIVPTQTTDNPHQQLIKDNKQKQGNMENFFYNNEFCHDLESLMNNLDLWSKEDVEKLEDDWSIDVIEGEYEKPFKIDEEFILDAVMESTERFDERLPEDPEDFLDQIKKHVKGCIKVDVEKLYSLMPGLYYAKGNKVKLTKADLIEFVS